MSFRIDQLAVYNLATVGGSITAGSFVKSGGTSSQFLKADGSVDTNTYITGITSGMVTTALGYTPVPNSRTLTINGTTYDLTADRSWTISIPVTSVSGSGAGISVSPTTGAVVISNTGVTSNVAGTGISVSGATGAVTITNTGVTSIVAGTAITVSGSTGAVTINNAGVTSVNGSTGALTGFATQSWVSSQGYITGVTNISGYSTMLYSNDIRTLSPSSLGAYRMAFGFTSWNNNNTADWADYIHLRSYSDASGGADNLVMFKKNGIGMRIWQQAWGSSTAYSLYADVLHSSNYNSYSPTLTGGGASGTWSINVTGTAGSETLATVTGRGASTTTRTTFVEVGATRIPADTVGDGPWFRWTNADTSRQMLTQMNTAFGLTTWAYNGSVWSSILTISSTGVITTTAASSRFGNVLIGDGTYKNTIKPIDDVNLNLSTPSGAVYFDTYGIATGSFRAPIFYDSDNTGYYLDPNSFSNLSTVRIQSLNSPNGDTVVAADSAMPAYKSSFIHTLGLGPGGNDGHILGMTWTNSSVYGAQIFLDTDPNDIMAIRSRSNAGVWTSWKTVLHSGNYNSYAPTLTGGGASGTWGINITGNAATASNASQLGGWTVAQIVPYHSGSDFPNGTLVVTNINAAVTSGDSFVMEVTGKSYQTGNSPFGLLLQGYIYADTFINCSAMSYGTTFPNVVILNYGGNLAFWWPRISYWNSFSVTVREAGGSSYNRVTSIGDSTEPSSTKKVTVSPFQVVHSGNIGSQSVSYASSAGNADTVDGYHASGLWKLNEWNGNIYAHTDGRIYGTIFYDANDSGYYLDPNSQSNLLRIKTNTNWYDNSATDWGGGVNMSGNNPSIGFQPTSSSWWYMLHHSTYMNFYRRSTSGSWNQDGIWDTSGNLYWNNGLIQSNASMRAPIFYDSNDTAYYLDPNSSSRIRNLYVGDSGSNWSDPGGWGTVFWVSNAPHAIIRVENRNDSRQAIVYSHQGQMPAAGSGGDYDFRLVRNYSDKITLGSSYITMHSSVNMSYANLDYVNQIYQETGGQGNYMYANNSGSYGTLRLTSTRNGWYGIYFDSGSTLMMNSNETGFYRQGYGWQWRWENGTAYVNKNSYGGGTSATVLDSSNYSSYALPLGGGSMSGTLTVSSPGNYWSSTTTGLTNAPLYASSVNVGASALYVPFTHMSAQYNAGYRTHVSTGIYKAASGWTGGWYMAIGGNDSYPTEAFFLNYGGSISHTNGYVTIQGSARAPIFYDSDNTSYYLDPNSTSNLYYIQMPYIGNGSPNILVNNGGSENWKAIEIGGSSSFGIGISGTSRSWSGRLSMAFHVGASQSFRVHSDGWDSLFEIWGSSGYARLKGSLEVGSDIYLGTRGNWLSTYLNQAVRTDSSPTFSNVTANGLIRVNGNTNLYLDFNYGCSIVGVYSSTRYQGVFAMGDAYKLAIDGSSTGSLYGLAWSHPNAGGVASNLNTHGLLVMENGTFLAAVSGSIRARDDMRAPIFYDSANTSYYADFANSGTSIKTAGNVLIGQTYDPGNKLQVNGNIYAVGDVTAYSDIRVKTNIRSIERVVERIMNVRGVLYDRTDIESNNNIGFIAQELEEQFPELVHTNNDGTKGVKYQNMTAILVEVVKKQQKQIDELKARLN